MRVAVLGGTGEARALAERLRVLPGVTLDLSLARDRPSGGFAGVDGLVEHLRSGAFDALVDATHPFAEVITSHAIAASVTCGVPLLVLRRPGWLAAEGDDWLRVPTFAAAVAALATRAPQMVFLAIGRKELGWFAGDTRHRFVLRMIDAPGPDVALPAANVVLLDRGPFEVVGERALLEQRGIEVIVTKDSGGSGAVAKLVAARELGLPVIMIDRPVLPLLPPDARVVETVPAALGWLLTLSR